MDILMSARSLLLVVTLGLVSGCSPDGSCVGYNELWCAETDEEECSEHASYFTEGQTCEELNYGIECEMDCNNAIETCIYFVRDSCEIFDDVD